MHRCLNVVEVQLAVFRELHCHPRCLGTLARLARTCRAFNNAALDVLWVSLDSFGFLIQCLPRDLWRVREYNKEIVFQRPMSIRDWEIFFRYSSRVQFLLQSVESRSLGDDVIFALSNPPTHGPIIPHLKTLHWDKPTKEHASLLRTLLTPSLVTLSFPFGELRAPEVAILTSIGTMCPSLKRLTIASDKAFGNVLDVKGEKVLSEALLHLHTLESLVCPALDEAAIVHLSRLPLLIELSMELQIDFQLDKVEHFLQPPAFELLQSLTLHASSLLTLTSLLQPMRLKPISLSFVVGSMSTPDALRLFFLALTTACVSERLRRISLTTSTERSGVSPQKVSLHTFQPLLALPNVETFEFDTPCPVVLDDGAIDTLTKHWPNLTSLSINAESGWGHSRVTHKGLITLLSRCHSLNAFALKFDFSEIDVPFTEVPESRLGDGVSNDKCLLGNFVASAVAHPITVAAFLSDVCPKLGVKRRAGELYWREWEEVKNLLPVFSAVRRQCMEWALRETKERNGTPA